MKPIAINRALHAIDVENLVGRSHLVTEDWDYAAATYQGLGVLGPKDHPIIAAHPGSCAHALGAWPSARIRAKAGTDGADLALLEVLMGENVEFRFTRVVIASGDHIFVPAVTELVASGVEVIVVARPNCVSRRLRMAATEFVPWPLAPVAPITAKNAGFTEEVAA